MAVRSVVLSGKRIITGVGALNSLSEYRYRRVAIVTGGSSMTRYGIIDRVKALFKGNGSEVFVISGIKKNPSFEEVFDGLKILNDFAPDCIVAVGGGSAIDCAKAMLLFYEFPYLNKANVLEFNSEGKIPKERKCGLICIPSTSGTGSEVTRGAVITDTEQKLKVPIMTDCLRPDVAILDPEVTLTMPSNIVAETGLDALTHAIESHTNKKLDDFDAALSMAAIAGIMKYLPASYHEGTLEAREKVHNYQAMAGISFANVGLGMVHGMAHSFGAAFNMGHGLTNAGYRKYYEPLLGSIYWADYCDPYRHPEGLEVVDGKMKCLEQFDEIFEKLICPDMVAAIIVEPVQGEGGYIVPDKGFLQGLREICDKHGIMLIFDEIQTGIGRTGELYAYQTFGVKPDILTSAKALGGGIPLSAVIAKKEIMDAWPSGAHGGTFGGNPLACAAGLKTLEIIERDNLLENCRAMGDYFLGKLSELQKKYPLIGDVRGVGLMDAIEIVTPDGKPDAATCSKIKERALEKNLLLLTCGSGHNVVRFIAPLNVTKTEIDMAVAVLDEVIAGL